MANLKSFKITNIKDLIQRKMKGLPFGHLKIFKACLGTMILTFLAIHRVRRPSLAYKSRCFWVRAWIFLIFFPKSVSVTVKQPLFLMRPCTQTHKNVYSPVVWIFLLDEGCSRGGIPFQPFLETAKSAPGCQVALEDA